jgi:hypothetical protein
MSALASIMSDPRPVPASLRVEGDRLPESNPADSGRDLAIALLFGTAIGSAAFLVRALCTGAASGSLDDLALAGLASVAGLVYLLCRPANNA